MLEAHPHLARLLSAILALGAIVALLGAHGLLAAALLGMAWFALPEGPERSERRRRSPA